MPTEIYAYLYISGDPVPFAEVSAALGVEPSRVERKGELPRPGARRPSPRDSWVLQTERRAGLDLDADVVRLLQRLDGREEALRALVERRQLEVGVNCVAYLESEDSTPSLNFEAPLLAKLGRIGADLDIDLYVY